MEPQSYGATFEVVTCDANYNLFPIVFAHFVGPESYDTWNEVFKACVQIKGFDVEHRTMIADQEKAIDKAYRECLKNAKLFLDPLHIRRNLGAKLGASKAAGLDLYNDALYAPTREQVDLIQNGFSEIQKA